MKEMMKVRCFYDVQCKADYACTYFSIIITWAINFRLTFTFMPLLLPHVYCFRKFGCAVEEHDSKTLSLLKHFDE